MNTEHSHIADLRMLELHVTVLQVRTHIRMNHLALGGDIKRAEEHRQEDCAKLSGIKYKLQSGFLFRTRAGRRSPQIAHIWPSIPYPSD
jgi:hypothetical protein